jgi:hypothetical protein
MEVDRTIFFDALPSEILVCTNRYAIASVPLNSLSAKQRLIFCESVGKGEGYASSCGISTEELERVVKMAMEVVKDIVNAANMQVEELLQQKL